MNYWRCKCGKEKYLESGFPPADCVGCDECGTIVYQPVGTDGRYVEPTCFSGELLYTGGRYEIPGYVGAIEATEIRECFKGPIVYSDYPLPKRGFYHVHIPAGLGLYVLDGNGWYNREKNGRYVNSVHIHSNYLGQDAIDYFTSKTGGE